MKKHFVEKLRGNFHTRDRRRINRQRQSQGVHSSSTSRTTTRPSTPLPQEQDIDGDGQLTFALIDTFGVLEQPSAPEYNRPEAAEKNDQSVDDVLDFGLCCICCIHHSL